jgi:Predicted membrane protein
MFCVSCGVKLPEGTSFCASCGKPQGNSPAPVQQPFQQQPYYVPAKLSTINALAVAGLVFGIIGFFLVFVSNFAFFPIVINLILRLWGVLGLVFSIIGFIKAKKSPSHSGLVMSVIGLCLSSIVFWQLVQLVFSYSRYY